MAQIFLDSILFNRYSIIFCYNIYYYYYYHYYYFNNNCISCYIVCLESDCVFLPESVVSGSLRGGRGWIPVSVRLCNRRHHHNLHLEKQHAGY